jgi:hypothetical protein
VPVSSAAKEIACAQRFTRRDTLDRLLADGHDVIGVDNFDPFYDRALKTANIEQHCAL